MSDDNIITRSKIDISFGTKTGFSSKIGFKSQNSDAMLDAIRELALMLKVEGRAMDVMDVVRDATEDR